MIRCGVRLRDRLCQLLRDEWMGLSSVDQVHQDQGRRLSEGLRKSWKILGSKIQCDEHAILKAGEETQSNWDKAIYQWVEGVGLSECNHPPRKRTVWSGFWKTDHPNIPMDCASFPSPLALGCDERLQGKRMRMEKSKESLFVHWSILGHSSVTSKLHHEVLLF